MSFALSVANLSVRENSPFSPRLTLCGAFTIRDIVTWANVGSYDWNTQVEGESLHVSSGSTADDYDDDAGKGASMDARSSGVSMVTGV